jgi:hypothetical protein
MINPYPTEVDQGWLRLWVHHHPESLLARYLLPMIPPPLPSPPPPPLIRPPSPPKPKKPGAPRKPREKRDPKERLERKIDREVERLRREPVSDWAKRLVGDCLTSSITLDQIIDSITVYFDIFDQMRRIDPDAYAYFSRSGVPIIMESTGFWERVIDNPQPILNADAFPAFVGAFFARTKEQERDAIINDKPSGGLLLDFDYFAKPRRHDTIAPPGSTIFMHNMIALNHHCFSKRELKKFPYARGGWGIGIYVGVYPDGSVKALPHHMSHYQELPNGGGVHHSAFHIPPGIVELGKGDPHTWVSGLFRVTLALIATSVNGLQVSIKKGKRVARFSIPIANARYFFADRDANDGERRKAILHLRFQHNRHLASGKVITVGEHLAGNRFFTWRGYEVSIGAAGLHFPSPEGFFEPYYQEGDPDCPPPDDVITLPEVGDRFQQVQWRKTRTKMRRGMPTSTFKSVPQMNLDGGTDADIPKGD